MLIVSGAGESAAKRVAGGDHVVGERDEEVHHHAAFPGFDQRSGRSS